MWHNWLRDGLRTQGSRRPVGNSRSRPRLEPLEERHLLNAAVSVIAQVAQASEVGPSPAIFRFTRTGDLSSPLQANFSLGGTAQPGVDYQVMDNTADFDAGSDTAYVTVMPRNDALNEGNETVTLTLTPDAGYTVGTTASATATIADMYVPGFPGVFNTPAPALPVSLTYLEAKSGGGQLQIEFVPQINTAEQPFVEFYLDTDQNPTTGDQRANHVAGPEYRVSVPINLGLANYTLYQEPLTPGQLQETTVAQNVGVQNQNGLYVLNIPLSELVSKPGNPPPAAVDVFAFAYGYSAGLSNDQGQGDRLPKYGAIDSSTGEVVVRDPVRTRIAYVSAAPGSASNGPYNLEGALFTTIADQFSVSLIYSQAINPSYAILQGQLVLDADRSLATGDIPMTGDITQGTGIPTWGGDTMLNFSIGGIQGPSFTLIHDLFYDPISDPSVNFGGSDNDGRWVYNGNVLTLSSSLSTFEPFEQTTQGLQYGSLRIPIDGDMYARVDMVNDLDVPYDSLPSAPGVVDTASGQALQPLTWDPTRTVSMNDPVGTGDSLDFIRVDAEVVQGNLVVKGVLSQLAAANSAYLYDVLLDTDNNASTGIQYAGKNGTKIGADYEVHIVAAQGYATAFIPSAALYNDSDRTAVSHDAWVNADSHPIEQPVPGSFTVTIPLTLLKNVGPQLRLYAASIDEVGIEDIAPPSPLVIQTGIPANLPPTVVTPASATPGTVTGTTTALSVLGDADGGEANLTYTWATTTLPSGAAAPTFSANGTNAAKQTVATFSEAGTYGFTVTIADAGGLTTTSSVNVVVNQSLTSIAVSPASVTVNAGGTQQFTATAKDQFGNAIATQPSFTWTATAGTITTGGLFTAPTTTGSVTVTATSGSCQSSANVNVTNNTILPATPSFTATAVSATQINLAWTPVAGATGYLVDQWINGAWAQVGSLSSGSTSYAVTGLSPNTTYYFDVAAYNAAGTTWANYQSATTQNTVVVDHPAADTAYSPVSGSLFGANGPSYLDVQQGQVGDCWLLASLAEVAARDPSDIRNMFTDVGSTMESGSVVELYTVRFFNQAGAPGYVTVDTELPSGGGYYDHPANGVLWVALAEKAYAEANGAGIVTTQYVGSDSYAALAGGLPAWALQAITGKSASSFAINPTNIAAAWNAGQLIVLGTSNPSSSYIVGGHAYAVVGYSSSSNTPFEVFNPWGTDSSGWAPGQTNKIYGLFFASAGFLSQNFAAQTFGTGTAAGLDDHGNSSQVGAGSANSDSAISASTRSSAQEPLLIALAPTISSQSIGRRHDHLDRALGSLMEDDLAFLRS